jgi:hypothetical protein
VFRVSDQLNARVLAVVAAVLTAAVAALYWYFITGQGDQSERRPQLVAASLVLAAFVLLASTAAPTESLRLLLLSLGSLTVAVWAVLGAMSIGVLLLPGVVPGLSAAGEASARVPRSSAWATLATAAGTSLLLALMVLRYS